jgi:hypothetical protein
MIIITSEKYLALSVLFGFLLLGYVSAWVFVHYLDNTDNGHMLRFLKRKWKEWRR